MSNFVVTRLDAHYKCRLIDVANNQLDANRSSRFIPSDTAIDLRSVCRLPVGNTGGPCKHQAAIIKVFQISSWNFLPVVDPEMRRLFHIVATGDTEVPGTWFDSLTSMPDAVHRESRDLKFHSKAAFSQDNESENVETCHQSHQLPDPALVDKLTQFYSRLKTFYYSDPLTLGPAIESCCNQALISIDSSIV